MAPPPHPARRTLLGMPAQPKPRRKKKEKPAHIHGPAYPKAHTVGPLKKRIRDLERLLSKDAVNIPADVRVAQERELASLRRELEVEEREMRRSEMIKRYHMVRFFESKKAERALKKARKALGDASGEAETRAAKALVHCCEVDLNYTKFYPFLKAYHALYPRQQGQIVGEEVKEKDEERMDMDDKQENANESSTGRGDRTMWKMVEKAMVDGTLELLRDGKLAGEEKHAKDGKKGKKGESSTKSRGKAGKAKTLALRQRGKAPHEEDDDSDGGFFE